MRRRGARVSHCLLHEVGGLQCIIDAHGYLPGLFIQRSSPRVRSAASRTRAGDDGFDPHSGAVAEPLPHELAACGTCRTRSGYGVQPTIGYEIYGIDAAHKLAVFGRRCARDARNALVASTTVRFAEGAGSVGFHGSNPLVVHPLHEAS